jgi:hypothetical protein
LRIQNGKVIAEGLSRSCGSHHHYILPLLNRFDRFGLVRIEAFDTFSFQNLSQKGMDEVWKRPIPSFPLFENSQVSDTRRKGS